MLVLKSIWKVISGTLFTILGSIVCLVLAVAAFFIIGFVLYWMGVLLATILGAETWAALCAGARGIIIYTLGALCLIGIITLFVLEVRDQYILEKAKAERRKEGWE